MSDSLFCSSMKIGSACSDCLASAEISLSLSFCLKARMTSDVRSALVSLTANAIKSLSVLIRETIASMVSPAERPPTPKLEASAAVSVMMSATSLGQSVLSRGNARRQ